MADQQIFRHCMVSSGPSYDRVKSLVEPFAATVATEAFFKVSVTIANDEWCLELVAIKCDLNAAPAFYDGVLIVKTPMPNA